MIASPGDVAEERQAVRDLIVEWNYIHAEDRRQVLLPVGWETHSTPLMGDRAQAIINKQVLVNCDLLVAVFWTKLGSPTGKAASGTVEEIEEHLAAGKPAMIYFSNTPVRPDSVNDKQYKALMAFKSECFKKGLVEQFEALTEFKEKFARQLTQTIIREFPAPEAADADEMGEQAENTAPLVRDLLSDDAKELLLAAANSDGNVLVIRTTGGTTVQAADRNFVGQETPKEVARWRSAVSELVNHNLLEDRGYQGELFEVTHRGHQVAEELQAVLGTKVNP
ncbi:MAG: DUF4062 domain-containing protein [Gemmataceae bacterium]